MGDEPLAAVLDLPDRQATLDFAAALAQRLAAGDVLLLAGDLGAGKTELARALIRTRAGVPLEVPSPTFTLVQVYQLPDLVILHADLYRLRDPAEILELGLDDHSNSCLLVEWPDRAPGAWPATALRLTMAGPFADRPERRRLALEGSPDWRRRLADLLP